MFVPERGAAALKVTAHCTDLRKRNCLGVPERGRKLLVRAAAVRHVVRLRPRTEPVPSGKQPGTVSAALSVRPAFGSCSHATAATPATSELKSSSVLAPGGLWVAPEESADGNSKEKTIPGWNFQRETWRLQHVEEKKKGLLFCVKVCKRKPRAAGEISSLGEDWLDGMSDR
nr:uncharacterized protein LOC110356209 isoform X2 [Columba livia]